MAFVSPVSTACLLLGQSSVTYIIFAVKLQCFMQSLLKLKEFAEGDEARIWALAVLGHRNSTLEPSATRQELEQIGAVRNPTPPQNFLNLPFVWFLVWPKQKLSICFEWGRCHPWQWDSLFFGASLLQHRPSSWARASNLCFLLPLRTESCLLLPLPGLLSRLTAV